MFDNLTVLCRKLGHHGICPEGLQTISSISGFLSDEVREELKQFMIAGRAMFAPVEPEIEILTLISTEPLNGGPVETFFNADRPYREF